MKIHRRCLLPIAIAATGFLALTAPQVKAAPFASCITNNAGTIQFYLNESGGAVLVTYEDGTSNSVYDGVSPGATNLPSGMYSFAMGAHTSYTIAVTKYGTGIGGLASNVVQMANSGFINAGNHVLLESGDPRGIAINTFPNSPYFGRIYVSRGGGSGNPTGFFGMNADGSYFDPYAAATVGTANGVQPTNAGVAWVTGAPYSSPDRMSITTNGFLVVGDYSVANAGVWLIDPNLNTNELLLGPIGDVTGLADGVHGAEPSSPVLLGNIDTGATLITVDGEIHTNSIEVYSNITQAAIAAQSSGPGNGWQKPPDFTGPQVAVNLPSNPNGPGFYFFPKLVIGPNGYLYSGQFRSGVSASDVPSVVVYDSTYTNLLFQSHYNNGNSDYFFTSVSGGKNCFPSDVAVSPDGKYLAAANIDGHLTVCMLTNGIPNVATIFTIRADVNALSNLTADAACTIAFDAADNPYEVVAGEFGVKQFTLGLSTTVTTAGNLNGVTNFVITPQTAQISVFATNNGVISQNNSYGNPTSGYFTIVRSGTPAALNQVTTVGISYSGASGTYTTTTTGSSVVFQPGQTVTNILITAVSDSTPRPTEAVTLTAGSSMNYSLSSPSATISIMNTATPYMIAAVGANQMYNAFSNDYTSMTITRWGDTNTTETVNSFTFAGTAVDGTDYTVPAPVTFVPGDLTHTVYINPLINGHAPVHNPNLAYTGNKTATLGLSAGSGYTAATSNATITIIDSAYPPAPVLFVDPLTNSADATNWGINAANGNLDNIPLDVDVEFGFNLYNAPSFPVPPPPNGATNALKMTVNKSGGLDDVIDNPMTAVNAYFTNAAFGGNYAVRFNMNVIQGEESSSLEQTIPGYGIYDSEEGPVFGINASGTETNWYGVDGFGLGDSQTNFPADGFWYFISDSGGAYFNSAQYLEFAGLGGTNLDTGWINLDAQTESTFATQFKTNVFTSYASINVPPYNSGWSEGGPGIPANGPPTDNLSAQSWSDVEVKQINNVVSLYIDKTRIFSYTNNNVNATLVTTNGLLMLGYDDPYNGGEAPDTAVYYSNLRVVQLTPPLVDPASVGQSGSAFAFNFGSSDGDLTPSSFVVQASTNLVAGAGFKNVTATITQVSTNGAEVFHAVVSPVSGPINFYRVVQK